MTKLATEVEPVQNIRLRTAAHKFFQGERKGDTFRIRRILGYGNGFLPHIRVTAASNIPGALMHVSMRPPIEALIVVPAFTLVFALIGLAIVLSGAPASPFPLWIALILVVLGLFLFNYEADKARNKLLEIFGGAMTEKRRTPSSNWPNA